MSVELTTTQMEGVGRGLGGASPVLLAGKTSPAALHTHLLNGGGVSLQREGHCVAAVADCALGRISPLRLPSEVVAFARGHDHGPRSRQCPGAVQG